MLIAFEGIDQSGKATQANLLCMRLSKAGSAVSQFSFPNYDGTIGKVIGAFLSEHTDLTLEARQMLP